jgi:hypothetical protein
MQHMLLMISSEAPPARRQSSQPVHRPGNWGARTVRANHRSGRLLGRAMRAAVAADLVYLRVWLLLGSRQPGRVAAGGWRGRSGWWGATVLLGGKGQCGTSQLAKCWGSIGGCALERESRFLAGPVVSGI